MADGLQGAAFQGALQALTAAAQGAHFKHLVAKTVAGPEQKQRSVGKAGSRDRGIRLPGVAGRHQHPEGFVVNCLGDDAGLLERQGHHDHIQIAPLEGLGEPGRVILLDEQRHGWRRGMHPGDQVRQQIGSDGVDHAEFERPGQGISPRSGQFLDLPGLKEHLFGLGDDARPDVGDLHVSRTAFKEGDGQFVLKLLDGHREGRLADIAAFGRMAEVTLTGQSDKIAKIGKRHQVTPGGNSD